MSLIALRFGSIYEEEKELCYFEIQIFISFFIDHSNIKQIQVS